MRETADYVVIETGRETLVFDRADQAESYAAKSPKKRRAFKIDKSGNQTPLLAIQGIFMPFEDKYSSTAIWPDSMPLPVDTYIDRNERRFGTAYADNRYHHVVRSLTGLAVSKDTMGVTVYGDRSMSNPREAGYHMEGRVSIGGKKISAFTSSQMFTYKGKLIDMAIFYLRSR